MNPAIVIGVATLILPLLRKWIEAITFIPWTTIEEALGPPLQKAGCKDVKIQPADRMVRVSLQKHVFGSWLPVELLILPIGLDLGREIRLGLSLQGAKLHRPSGFRALIAYGIARVGPLVKRTTVEKLIVDAVAQHGEVQGNVVWFCLDEVPPFDTLTGIRRKIPVDIPLSPLATCDGIHPEEDGVQFDISAGPAVRIIEPLLNPLARVIA
jgi:hypothetical protein